MKATVRLDSATHGALYAAAEDVARRLGVAAAVTLYQAGGEGANAALFYLRDEVHVVLQGKIATALNEGEIRAPARIAEAHHLICTAAEIKRTLPP